MKKIDYDDIKVVVTNPECIPIAQKRLFDFCYERYTKECAKKDNNKNAQLTDTGSEKLKEGFI